ncbi:MAG: dTMP kinase [Trueperaceae bacterium]|nr:dTMP kinase [Trueperaceae bacterium]
MSEQSPDKPLLGEQSPDKPLPDRQGDGRLIVFEGPEGAGKSTQLRLLAARLEQAGRSVITTREPGGTPEGDQIRALVLEPSLHVTPLAEFLLYSASRAQLVSEVIGPALAAGQTVLCDRYTGSSVAYQGYGRGLDLDFVARVNHEATGGLRPDLTVLLDIDPVAGLQRVAQRGASDRLERADLDFHHRVRRGFLAQADAEGWRLFDAARDEQRLGEQIWRLLREYLGL